MMENIEYEWIDGCQSVVGSWTGSRVAAIDAACDALDAQCYGDDEYVYEAHEISRRIVVDEDDMVRYGAALLGRGYPQSRKAIGECYSVWCANSTWVEGV